MGDEGGVDGVVRGGGGRSRKRRTRRRFSSPAAEERSQQRGGGGRGGARVAWTRRTLAAGRRSPGQLRWTANDGALRGGQRQSENTITSNIQDRQRQTNPHGLRRNSYSTTWL